jgi:hypothetical protein
MKKILLLALALTLPSIAAQTQFNGTLTARWNTAANWSGLAVPDTLDTCTIAAVCTVDVAARCAKLIKRNSQVFIATGQTIYSRGGIIIDSASVLNLGNRLTITSDTLKIGATVGTVTATSCTITAMGTGNILADNKGVVFKNITHGANAVVSSIGVGSTAFEGVDPLITFTNGGTLTFGASANIILRLAASASFISVLAGTPTINQNCNIIQFRIGTANSLTGTIPAISIVGTGKSITFPFLSGTQTGSVIILSSGFSHTGNVDISSNTTGSPTYNIQGITVGGIFKTGNAAASGMATTTYTGTNSFGSFDGATSNTAASVDAFGSSVINCAGNWSFGSNHTVTHVASLVNSTGNALFTSAGKSFCDLTVNNAGTGSFRNADSLYLTGDLTLTDGRDSLMFPVKCVDYTNNTTDSVFQGANNYISGAFSRAAGTKVKRTAGSTIFNGAGSQPITLNNNAIGPIVNSKASGTLAFADSGRIQKYTAGVDSLALTFTGAKGLRIDTTDTASLNGIVGKLNRYGAASGTARLYLPAVYTHSYSSWTGISVLPIDQVANNGTVVNGGGNIGFLFPATSGRRGGSRGLINGILISP